MRRVPAQKKLLCAPCYGRLALASRVRRGLINAGGHCTHKSFHRRIKMKRIKKLLGYATVFAVLMVFGACSSLSTSTKAYVYDKSVPRGETCKLTVPSSLYVQTFNGKKWKWRTPLFGNLEVTIPAGSHTIGAFISYEGRFGNEIVNIKTDVMTLTYEFKAGREYILGTNPKCAYGNGGIFYLECGLCPRPPYGGIMV